MWWFRSIWRDTCVLNVSRLRHIVHCESTAKDCQRHRLPQHRQFSIIILRHMPSRALCVRIWFSSLLCIVHILILRHVIVDSSSQWLPRLFSRIFFYFCQIDFYPLFFTSWKKNAGSLLCLVYVALWSACGWWTCVRCDIIVQKEFLLGKQRSNERRPVYVLRSHRQIEINRWIIVDMFGTAFVISCLLQHVSSRLCRCCFYFSFFISMHCCCCMSLLP